MMKKFLSLLMAALMSLFIGACATNVGTDSSEESTNKDTTAPVISGVSDTSSIALGESYNALKGVTATDDVDGDLTSKLSVSAVPTLTFEGGITTPEKQGTYELVYEVKDKAGNTGNAYTTLTVTRPIAKEQLYKKYEFNDSDMSKVNTFGFAPEFLGGAAGNSELKDGVLRVNVTNSGATVDNVMFNKRQLATQEGKDYKVSLYMKASAPVLFHLIANNTTAGWAPLGNSAWNLMLTEKYARYDLIFPAPLGEANVEILMQMGKMQLNDVINPDAYILDVLKIEFYEYTGVEKEVVKYASDYATNIDGFEAYGNEGSGALVTAEKANDKALVKVAAYPTAGESWAMRMIQAVNTPMVKDQKYRLRINVKATNAQYTEVMVEHRTLDWQARAYYINNVNLEAGKDTNLEYDFVASADIADSVVVRIDIGKANGNTSNTIEVASISLVAIEGDKVEAKQMYRFMPFNSETEFDCFNGSDAGLVQGGLGSMYIKDNKLIYNIDEISKVDYGNKFFANKITLEEGGIYKVKFTMKANKDAKCWFILNKYKDFDPKINKVVDLTTEEQTFEFSTDSEMVLTTDFELVFSFGESYNTGSDLVIELTSLEVWRLA